MRFTRALVAVPLALASLALGQALAPEASAIPSDPEVFSENFETDLSLWNVTQAANGSVSLVTGTTPAGTSKVVKITVPDYTSNSIAYLRRGLPQPVYAISVSGYFNVTKGGCDGSAGYSSGSVPFIRLFDTGGRRVAGLYRINSTSCNKTAKVYVQHSGSFFRTGKNIGLGQWAKWELRITVNGPSSQVQVYLNGAPVYSASANNGIVPIASVTLHNEHNNQVGELLADDIRVGTFTSPIPSNPCAAGTPQPTNADPGNVVLADNYESYNLNKWTGTGVAGDGAAYVTADTAHTGNCSALVHVTGNSGSRAYLSKTLPAGSDDVYLDGWFNVRAEGASGNNVPFWRLFNGDARLADIYRLNGSGQLYARTPNGSGGYTYTSLGRTVPLNTWHRVQVHADIAAGTLEFRYDGVLLKTLTGVPFGASAFTSAQIAAEHFVQQGDLAADDTIIKVVP